LVSAPLGVQAAPRVLSLDQCADQFVMALSPRDAIVGVSSRADDLDSRLRLVASGLPKRRVDLESVLAARPDVVVRYWGGEPRLVQALQARGVQVVNVDEASNFAAVRANIRKVADALQQRPAGERLVARLDGQLNRAANAWAGREALYLTPGGATTGPGTLVDAILRAAGFTNAETRAGFRTVSLERLALAPPPALVLGFFDSRQATTDRWGIGGHRLLRDAVETRALASLPAALLSCPDGSAGDAVARLAKVARP
jgi:iron complex transport system substrate-binding protein